MKPEKPQASQIIFPNPRVGILDEPQLFLSADTRYWIIAAIVLAELWRATSIVMVIVVSGLQAIPDETLEAAELFGANYWQRVRHIMLPLLRPSIQVALILRTILFYQVFAVVIALSGGDVVTTLAREMIKDVEDVAGDEAVGARTLPLVYGVGVAMRATVGVLFLTLLLTPLPFLLFDYRGLFLLLLLACDALLLHTLWLFLGPQPEKQAHRASQLLKAVMAAGMTALAFGAIVQMGD